jgi:hypothetical protein
MAIAIFVRGGDARGFIRAVRWFREVERWQLRFI